MANFVAVLSLGHPGLNEREQRAYDLYGASFHIQNPEARLLLLCSALELLADGSNRSEAAQSYIDELIRGTKELVDRRKLAGLPVEDFESLAGGLGNLKRRSSINALKALVGRLEPRTYNGKSPSKFIVDCYRLRSRVIHSDGERMDHLELSYQAVSLGLLVGDLIAGDLRDTVPDYHPRSG